MTDERLSEAEIDDCLTGLDQIALPYRTVWRLTPFADYLLVVARAIRQLRADLAAAVDQAHNATADLSRAAEAAGLAPYGGAWNPERLVPAIRQLRADLKAAQSRIEEEDRNYVAMMELRDQAERQVGQLRADLAAAKDAAQQLEEALLDAIIQGAEWDAATGVLDSCALRAFAEGMELLAERGRLTIEKSVGRRVIARINRKAATAGETMPCLSCGDRKSKCEGC